MYEYFKIYEIYMFSVILLNITQRAGETIWKKT